MEFNHIKESGMAKLQIFMPEPKCNKCIYVTGAETVLSEQNQVHPFAKKISAKIPGQRVAEIAGTLSDHCEYLLIYHLGDSAKVAWDFQIEFVDFGVELLSFAHKKALVRSEDQGYMALFRIQRDKWSVNWQLTCPIYETLSFYSINQVIFMEESEDLLEIKRF